MLFAGLGQIHIVKNCDLGRENAALGLRPQAAFSSPGSQFFTIRTSQPLNNIYLCINEIRSQANIRAVCKILLFLGRLSEFVCSLLHEVSALGEFTLRVCSILVIAYFSNFRSFLKINLTKVQLVLKYKKWVKRNFRSYLLIFLLLLKLIILLFQFGINLRL